MSLLCPRGVNDTTCLTATEASAINKIWRGATNERGNKKLWYGQTRGTDLNGLGGANPFGIAVAQPRFWVYFDPTWDWHILGYDNYEAFFNDTVRHGRADHGLRQIRISPDSGITVASWYLARLRRSADHARGQHRLLRRGREDPGRRLRAHERVRAAVHGARRRALRRRRGAADPEPVRRRGGLGRTRIAPETILASRPITLPDGSVRTRTRPLCAYPDVAVWTEQVSSDDAASFVCERGRDHYPHGKRQGQLGPYQPATGPDAEAQASAISSGQPPVGGLTRARGRAAHHGGHGGRGGRRRRRHRHEHRVRAGLGRRQARHAGRKGSARQRRLGPLERAHPHALRQRGGRAPAWASFPVFRDWRERMGGPPVFTHTGFVAVVGHQDAAALRANVEMLKKIGIDTTALSAAELKTLQPIVNVDDVGAAAYEPASGYASPADVVEGFRRQAQARARADPPVDAGDAHRPARQRSRRCRDAERPHRLRRRRRGGRRVGAAALPRDRGRARRAAQGPRHDAGHAAAGAREAAHDRHRSRARHLLPAGGRRPDDRRRAVPGVGHRSRHDGDGPAAVRAGGGRADAHAPHARDGARPRCRAAIAPSTATAPTATRSWAR